MAVYGFRPAGSLLGLVQTKRFTVGAVAIAVGDLVNLVAGLLVVVEAGDFIAGVVEETGAISASNISINVSPFLTGYMQHDNDSATFAATHVGYGFDMVGTTGIMRVDTNTADNTQAAPTGQMVALEYNPQEGGYASDTAMGLMMIVEHQFYQRNI